MAWFKVDDSFYDHPKVFDAPDCAVALWVRAGSWASRNLTDGFVPTGMPRRLCDDPETAAKELVARGLWDHVEGGYRFHDWGQQQPSRERVLADRAASSRRQALVRNPELREFVRHRDQNRCRYCGTPVEWKDRRSPLGGTFDHVDPGGQTDVANVVVSCRGCAMTKGARGDQQPQAQLLPLPDQPGIQNVSRYDCKSDLDSSAYPTRPDPTRTSYGSSSGEASSASPPDDAPKKPSPKRGSRIPADFKVTPKMVAWARERCPGVDGRLQTELFVNYWQAKAGPNAIKRDWEATWRNWMLKANGLPGAVNGAPGSPPGPSSAGTGLAHTNGWQPHSPADQRLADAMALAARYAEEDGTPL